MKRCLLAAAALLLICFGCVGYYRNPYPYGPYSYNPYYYPSYGPPAIYYDPSWMLFYPSFSFGFGYRGYPRYWGYPGYRGYPGYPGYQGYRGYPYHGGGRY